MGLWMCCWWLLLLLLHFSCVVGAVGQQPPRRFKLLLQPQDVLLPHVLCSSSCRCSSAHLGPGCMELSCRGPMSALEPGGGAITSKWQLHSGTLCNSRSCLHGQG